MVENSRSLKEDVGSLQEEIAENSRRLKEEMVSFKEEIGENLKKEILENSRILKEEIDQKLLENSGNIEQLSKELDERIKEIEIRLGQAHVTRGDSFIQPEAAVIRREEDRIAPIPHGQTKLPTFDGKTPLEEFLTLVETAALPLSIVEDQGFKDFVTALNPNYVIPSKKTIKNNILNIYEILKNNTQMTLEGLQNVTLTIDVWSSNANENYLSVTAHYISDDYTLTNYVIETVKLSDRHSPQHIAETLKNIIHNWKINVLVIVTDGSTKMVSTIALLENVQHIKCFAHTLNVIIRESMHTFPEIQEIRKKCGDIIQYLRHSDNVNEVLQKLQENVSEPQLKLIPEVEIRWNSTYYMLQRFIDLKEILTAALLALKCDVEFINDNEFQIIEDILKILKPFEEITVEMSREEYVNISKVLVIRNSLLIYLDELKFSTNSIAYYFKLEVINNIKAKMDVFDNSHTIIMASLLDPRFKLLSFQTETEKDLARAKLIFECNSLIQENIGDQFITPDNPVTPSCSIWKKYDEEVKHQDSYEPRTLLVLTK
ncbi:dna replication-related element factor isoform a [Holotrichia oblita]|uniref:Dna replication-related element factor isoform a n=1 Tax=Holotrichia oblita TaxID=644536 RepID=A0ACB9TG62_HOLOL|nr:dna replication-related element factor isoform a [Holotrichia oblita]